MHLEHLRLAILKALSTASDEGVSEEHQARMLLQALNAHFPGRMSRFINYIRQQALTDARTACDRIASVGRGTDCDAEYRKGAGRCAAEIVELFTTEESSNASNESKVVHASNVQDSIRNGR